MKPTILAAKLSKQWCTKLLPGIFWNVLKCFQLTKQMRIKANEKKRWQIFAQWNNNVLELMVYKWYIKVLVVFESWPFSCPAPTVLLSRSFSFQSAFSSFSMVGITVNRTQQVLSRAALGCTRWREKYILSNKIYLTPNYFLSLSSGFLMALIEEDIWGGEGQRLFVPLGEVLSVWVDRYLDGEQSKVS